MRSHLGQAGTRKGALHADHPQRLVHRPGPQRLEGRCCRPSSASLCDGPAVSRWSRGQQWLGNRPQNQGCWSQWLSWNRTRPGLLWALHLSAGSFPTRSTNARAGCHAHVPVAHLLELRRDHVCPSLPQERSGETRVRTEPATLRGLCLAPWGGDSCLFPRWGCGRGSPSRSQPLPTPLLGGPPRRSLSSCSLAGLSTEMGPKGPRETHHQKAESGGELRHYL